MKKKLYTTIEIQHILCSTIFFPPHYKITLDEHSSQSFMFMMDNLFEWDAEWVLNGIIHGQKSCLNNVFLLLFATYTIIFFYFSFWKITPAKFMAQLVWKKAFFCCLLEFKFANLFGYTVDRMSKGVFWHFCLWFKITGSFLAVLN